MAIFRNRKRQTEVLERPEYGWIWKPLLFLVVLYLVVCIALGIWWSLRPDSFDVEQATAERRGVAATTPAARGAVTTATLTTAVDTLLDKPGGFLRNDVAPPGLWLDNMPSWEYGVLTQSRLLVLAIRSMSPGQTALLEEAEETLNSNSRDWIYTAAEKRYGEAVEALDGYLATLSAEQATGFTPNGNALAVWLRTVAQRFDELSRRLSASIDDPEALRELGVDEADLPESTPWYRIDNTFYEARGDAWAFMHFLRAARRDYGDVFAEADATATVDRLIAELEMAQRRLWSPVVLNGSGFGIFANHSLLLANYTMAVEAQARKLANSVEGVEVESRVLQGSQVGAQSTTDPQAPSDTGSQESAPSAPQDTAGMPSDGHAEDAGAGNDVTVPAGEPAEGGAAEGRATEEGAVAEDAVDESASAQGRSGDDITPPEPAEAAPEAPVAPPVSEEAPPALEEAPQR